MSKIQVLESCMYCTPRKVEAIYGSLGHGIHRKSLGDIGGSNSSYDSTFGSSHPQVVQRMECKRKTVCATPKLSSGNPVIRLVLSGYTAQREQAAPTLPKIVLLKGEKEGTARRHARNSIKSQRRSKFRISEWKRSRPDNGGVDNACIRSESPYHIINESVVMSPSQIAESSTVGERKGIDKNIGARRKAQSGFELIAALPCCSSFPGLCRETRNQTDSLIFVGRPLYTAAVGMGVWGTSAASSGCGRVGLGVKTEYARLSM
ncbi:hypothetical protein C8J56DRAFT_1026266, partial [Mycena floridula]